MNVSEILGSYAQKVSTLGVMRVIFRKSRSLSAKSPIYFLLSSSFLFFSAEISRGCRRWRAAVAAACGGAIRGAAGGGARLRVVARAAAAAHAAAPCGARPTLRRCGARAGARGAVRWARNRAAALCGARLLAARGSRARRAVTPGGARPAAARGNANGCYDGGRRCRAGHSRRRLTAVRRRGRRRNVMPCCVVSPIRACIGEVRLCHDG